MPRLTGRRRYLRHSQFGRFRTGPDSVARSDGALGFWTREGARLASGAVGQTFTADENADELGVTGHGFVTGQGPFQVTSAGTLPAGLSATSKYYVSVVDSNTVQLHEGESREAALAQPAVDFTDAGTGSHTITHRSDADVVFNLNRVRPPRTIMAATAPEDVS